MLYLEDAKSQLAGIIKPFQLEQNARQRKGDFLKKCLSCLEKNLFFQLDELLNSKQVADLLNDGHFQECAPIFDHLRTHTSQQIESYRLEFKESLLSAAREIDLPMEVDMPRFSVLKGIEGKVDFARRSTMVNQSTLKSIDPKRIVSAASTIKRKLYDSPFDPQVFIDSLLRCYKEVIKKHNFTLGDAIPICELYAEYVWSLQSQAFLQNMDKGKFRGYPVDQFAVDFWRFFQSGLSAEGGGYGLRMGSGKGRSLWLIDQVGERRSISHILFAEVRA